MGIAALAPPDGEMQNEKCKVQNGDCIPEGGAGLSLAGHGGNGWTERIRKAIQQAATKDCRCAEVVVRPHPGPLLQEREKRSAGQTRMGESSWKRAILTDSSAREDREQMSDPGPPSSDL